VRRAFSRSIAACLLVSISTSCSTSYTPKPDSRLHLLIKNGGFAFEVDGKVYEGGAFGGGLEEAVHGNPEAEAHALAFQSDLAWGTITLLGGMAGLVGGVVLAGAGASRPGHTTDQGLMLAALCALVSGVALDLVSVGFMLKAPTHMYDAINIYNDGIPAPPPPSTRTASISEPF
jgi:hypothetical protein